MQSHYPEQFERDMACTQTEWLAWLPQAVGEYAWRIDGQTAHVQLAQGSLLLTWQVLPPRTIALLRLPRLGVRFEFTQTHAQERQQFMRRFDLTTQRGGG